MAKGYTLGEDGIWKEGTNQIKYPNETQEEVDNFVSYEFRNIEIDKKSYYLFIKKFNSGWFDYPSIYKGWHSTIDAEWFVVDIQDIDSMQINYDSINFQRINTHYHGWVENSFYNRSWNNSTYLSEIKKSISEQKIKNEESDQDLVIHFAPYSNSKVVRFNFYALSELSKYGSTMIWMISNEYEPKDPNGKYSFDTLKIFGTDALFEYCYYETSFEAFSKFIKLK